MNVDQEKLIQISLDCAEREVQHWTKRRDELQQQLRDQHGPDLTNSRPFKVGDQVWVDTPGHARMPGFVTLVGDDGSIGIQGPKVDDVRVWSWFFEPAWVRRFVGHA